MKKKLVETEEVKLKTRAGARVKVGFRRVKEILKITLFIAMIVLINQISNRATNIIQQMSFDQMKIVVFTFITTLVLYIYLKSCEEIKQAL